MQNLCSTRHAAKTTAKKIGLLRVRYRADNPETINNDCL